MDELTPPLFLIDGGSIDVFNSIRDLCRYVEPIDAATAGFVVFDASGLRIELRRVGSDGRFFAGDGETVAEPTSPAERDPDALALTLSTYMLDVGPDRFGVSAPWIANARLDELVEVVAAFLRK